MICSAHPFFSGDQIENNGMSGACSAYGERRDVYRVLVAKLEGRRPLGRTWRRWEGNIKMYREEEGCEGCGLERSGSG